MILRAINLLHLTLVAVFLSSVSFEVVDVPVPGQDIYLEPEPPVLHATVTAYSSSPDETWGDPMITASGRRVFDGLVACASRIPNSLGRIRPTCVASAQCGPRRVVARHGATAPGRTVAACVQRALLDSHPVSAKRPEDGG